MSSKKDRTLSPNVERTIVSMRAIGVPERNTYETLRRNLKSPPSYRDIRAAYERAGMTTRHEATVRRRKGFLLQASEPNAPLVKSFGYRDGVSKITNSPYIAESARPLARRELDDNFFLGYGYRAGIDPDDIRDDVRLYEAMDSIEHGEGS